MLFFIRVAVGMLSPYNNRTLAKTSTHLANLREIYERLYAYDLWKSNHDEINSLNRSITSSSTTVVIKNLPPKKVQA